MKMKVFLLAPVAILFAVAAPWHCTVLSLQTTPSARLGEEARDEKLRATKECRWAAYPPGGRQADLDECVQRIVCAL